MWRSDATLKADIARWQRAGWVTARGAQAIAAEIAARRGPRPAAVMGLLGVALFAFAAMSFVAANWQEIPRIVRLGLLVSAMGGCYAAAAALFARQLPMFAHAGVLAGASLFGVNIMLISQMYHIDGNPPDAVLVWALGALAAGTLVASRPALALALGLMCLWGGWETELRNGAAASRDNLSVYWPFLLGWGAVTAAIARDNWRNGLHLCALALAAFLISLGVQLPGGHEFHVVVLIGLAIAGAGIAGGRFAQHLPEPACEAEVLTVYGTFVAGMGLYFGQFQHDVPGYFAAWAAFALALAVAAIFVGIAGGKKTLARLGYAGFTAETLTIYFKTVGSLLGSAGFFLSAGLILIVIAVTAFKLDRRPPANQASRGA